jgi:hypothetical protein
MNQRKQKEFETREQATIPLAERAFGNYRNPTECCYTYQASTSQETANLQMRTL